uniref:Uncharacterized protein n=1 Tax=Hanusia phi TaxID=3032 RepID=A0A7S0DVR7_9CRYP
MMVNLSKLKCPCGTPFRNSTQSAFCSMCCTATCSAACHKVFCQDAGMCFYHLNYIFETQSDIYGCRDIRWCVIERSTPGTYLSRVCGPRYLEAIMGKDVMSLIVRRGYCQYGQPLDSTISAFMPLPKDVQRLPNPFRLNICTCKVCSNRQPHAACHSICPFLHPVPELDVASRKKFTAACGLPAGHPLSDEQPNVLLSKASASSSTSSLLSDKKDVHSRLGIQMAGKQSVVDEVEDEG